MALQIINGVYAVIDMLIATVSVKCAFKGFSANIQRDYTEQTTACSTQWADELMGRLRLTGQLEGGYVTKGAAYSDPLSWVTSSTPLAMVLQADTGCTLVGSANITGDSSRVMRDATAEASKSTRAVPFRSTGSWTTIWVVT